MLDDINQRKLERELTMLLTAVFGCSSPTNNTIASIQASELLEEMRVLAETESMHYEHLKHSGELPIIGVNTFRNPKGDSTPQSLELARSTDEEK